MTVTITKQMEDKEFWSSIMGNMNYQFDWWIACEYLGDSNWDKPGEVRLTIDDGEGHALTRVLTLEGLVAAYNFVTNETYGTHINIDNMDEVYCDMVLQYFMFGDIIFG